MSIRIATFNVENLMNRFDFSGFRNQLQQDRALTLYDIPDEAHYRQYETARALAATDDSRQLSALAIAATKADVLCLQEVDNLEALKAFEYGYLFKMIGAGYRQKFMAAGNDSRGIDVAMMMRDETRHGEPIEFVRMTSHAHVTFADFGLFNPSLAAMGLKPEERIFRRDCLEIDLRVAGRPLTLYGVHLKSMGGARNGVPGRESTSALRTAEAKAVRLIIERRFGADHAAEKSWAILGDLNEYREKVVVEGEDENLRFTEQLDPAPPIEALTRGAFCVNVVESRPPIDRWTLYHTRGPQERHLCQLDYILLSRRLARHNANAVPDIVRAGQPWRTPFPPGQEVDRYPRIGWDRPKASDHCPVAITLDIP